MKYLTILLLGILLISCKKVNAKMPDFKNLAQTNRVDTLSSNPGKPGGFVYIREYYKNGKVKRAININWKNDGTVKRRYALYTDNKALIESIDSTFNKSGNVSSYERQIGDDNTGVTKYFQGNGSEWIKIITLNKNGHLIQYKKVTGPSNKYYIMVDSPTPEWVDATYQDFSQAQREFTDLLVKSSVSAN